MPRVFDMRYGCNPHQTPARIYREGGPLPFTVLNGAPGYINLLDALNSWQLVRELKQVLNLPAAASFKHVSPAGAAVAVPISEPLKKAYFVNDLDLSPIATAYARARGADRLSSYGDWAALSDTVDIATANLLRRESSDGIIAPDYEPEALEILKKKKEGKYVILQMDPNYEPNEIETRQVFGIMLEQTRNNHIFGPENLENIVTQNSDMSSEAKRDLIVASIALKYTQSNSIALALDGQTIGVGAGQQNRLACTDIAASKAETWFLRQHPDILDFKFAKGLKRPQKINAIETYLRGEMTNQERQVWKTSFSEVPEPFDIEAQKAWLANLQNVALSSDAFIPFRDNIDRASKSGVKYIVQTSGSIQDQNVIAAANEYGMIMVFSGIRLFHH